MALTRYSINQLTDNNGILGDNVTGDITAQDMRNTVWSLYKDSEDSIIGLSASLSNTTDDLQTQINNISGDNFYTTNSFLSGTELIFNRNDTLSAYSVDLSNLSFNFSNTDLTFDTNRSHNTNGFDLEITTDSGNYGKGWIYIQNPSFEGAGSVGMGWSNSSIIINDSTVNLRSSDDTITNDFIVGSSSTIFNVGSNNVDLQVRGSIDGDLMFVNSSTDRIGVGINEPTSKLHINGDLRIETIGSTTASTILATDASGNVVDGYNLITDITLAGNNGEIQFNNNGEFDASSNLYWDNANGRLSVGQGTNPLAIIDIKTTGSLDTDLSFRVRDNTNTFDIININGVNEITLSNNTIIKSPDESYLSLTSYGDINTIHLSTDGDGYAESGLYLGTVTGKAFPTELYNFHNDVRLIGGTNSHNIRVTTNNIQLNASITTVQNKMAIGHTFNDPQITLDIMAQGALSTDIPLRVRNSDNTTDLLKVNGEGILETISTNASTIALISSNHSNSYTNYFKFGIGGSSTRPSEPLQIIQYKSSGRFGFALINQGSTFATQDNNFYFGNNIGSVDKIDRNVLYLFNGVPPTVGESDGIKFYSADIIAGNAAPHFRTEAGDVVKLYKSDNGSSSKDIFENTGLIGIERMVYVKNKTKAPGDETIMFDEPRVYSSPTSPLNDNLLDNFSDSKLGVVQKIYHTSATVPTLPAGWVNVGTTTYDTTKLNIIYAEWAEGTRVEYRIYN